MFADFTLCDKSDAFTHWLVSRGNLHARTWLGYNVVYHLEIKSTYGSSYEGGFHMSQNQLDLARQWQIEDGKVPRDVYVILRVSNMTGRAAAVVPYVDPATMFEDGRLTFNAPEGYHVFAT